MIVRKEQARDFDAVYAVNAAAFPTADEAHLVDVLREQGEEYVSMVAEDEGAIIGHIMFTPIQVANHPDLRVMGLGPVAVLPKRQGAGVGALLVTNGLKECERLGYGAVVVLGHPWYYPRFGFVPASRYGLHCQFDAPDEAFMALELTPGYLEGVSGTAVYYDAFGDV